jgi:hypothetical protein
MVSVDKQLLSKKSLNSLEEARQAECNTIIELLKLRPSQKSNTEISIIQDLALKINFFKDRSKMLENSMREICEKMTYEFVKASNVLFM